MNPQKFSHTSIGIFLSIATVIILGLVVFVNEYSDGDSDQVATDTTTQNASTSTQVPVASIPIPSTPIPVTTVITPPPATVPKHTTSVYTDGTYTANGTYMSPGGQDTVSVTLTLANDIITSITTTATGDRESQHYQSRFLSGYKQYVVGKNISSVNLTNVSGSSLTPIGFDNALTQIKAQAKV